MTLLYTLTFAALLAVELLYFGLAKRFNITDTPNERSSHSRPTIRGGGIVFVIAVLLFELLSGFRYPWFFLGTALVAGVSFVDDMVSLPSKLRLPVQIVGVLLLFADTGAFAQPLWWLVTVTVVVAGIANVFNFMDGINGITGMYGLVTLASLAYLNERIGFTDGRLILFAILSLIVFGLFNFRRKAVTFAGDVGSIGLAFIILFLLLRLVLATGNYYFILLLAVYGVDAGLTIFQRLAKRENILEAHRSHLYQWLVKPGPFSHLQVALIYAALQLSIDFIVVQTWRGEALQLWGWAGVVLVGLISLYTVVKMSYRKQYSLT